MGVLQGSITGVLQGSRIGFPESLEGQCMYTPVVSGMLKKP